jgi:hypothetical protein
MSGEKRNTWETLFLLENALCIKSCRYCKNAVTEYSDVWGEYATECSRGLMANRDYCNCDGFEISERTQSVLDRLKKDME